MRKIRARKIKRNVDNLPNNPISEYTCSHGDPLMRNPCLMIKKA